MADHVRKQLREAVAAAVTGLTTTGARVFQSRVYPIQAAELPGLSVYTESETAEESTVEPDPTVRRVVELRVDGYASAVADLDDVLDQIAKEVETALAPGVSVSGQSVELVYTGCQIDQDAEAARPHGLVSLQFTAELFTTSGVPDVLT